MFAPHCPTCRTRVLLGTDRIVAFAADRSGERVVVLRCTCGDLVDWDQRPPVGADAATDLPAAAVA